MCRFPNYVVLSPMLYVFPCDFLINRLLCCVVCCERWCFAKLRFQGKSLKAKCFSILFGAQCVGLLFNWPSGVSKFSGFRGFGVSVFRCFWVSVFRGFEVSEVRNPEKKQETPSNIIVVASVFFNLLRVQCISLFCLIGLPVSFRFSLRASLL